MRQLFCIKIFVIILVLQTSYALGAEEQKNGFDIAIAPFLPVKTLVKNYATLRMYLQLKFNEPVTIISAPDYQTFYNRIRMREYPIIITPANSAYLAWSESGYIPLLRPLEDTMPVLIIRRNTTFLTLSELRGKSVAMSDALAIVSMQGEQMLHEAGLVPGQDVTIINLLNHAAAVNHVIAGEVSAAIVSDRALQQMPVSIQDKIIIAYTWDKVHVPGIFILGSPKLSKLKLEKIKQAIDVFANNTEEGIQLMNDFGYRGLADTNPDELKPLKYYGELLKKAMDEER